MCGRSAGRTPAVSGARHTVVRRALGGQTVRISAGCTPHGRTSSVNAGISVRRTPHGRTPVQQPTPVSGARHTVVRQGSVDEASRISVRRTPRGPLGRVWSRGAVERPPDVLLSTTGGEPRRRGVSHAAGHQRRRRATNSACPRRSTMTAAAGISGRPPHRLHNGSTTRADDHLQHTATRWPPAKETQRCVASSDRSWPCSGSDSS